TNSWERKVLAHSAEYSLPFTPLTTSSSNAAAASTLRIMLRAWTGTVVGNFTGTVFTPRVFNTSSSACGVDSNTPTRISVNGFWLGQENGRSTAARSLPSAPWIAPKTRAQSSRLRAMGPSLSMLHERAMHPARETRPKVGRRPETWHAVHGLTMD